MNGIDWTVLTGIGGFIVVLLLISIRAGIILKDMSSSTKKMISDQVTIPVVDLRKGINSSVDHLSDKVSSLSKHLTEFTNREKEDHRHLMEVMNRSSHSHKEMLTMMKRIDNDHKEIKAHRQKIARQHQVLIQHKKDIRYIEQTKADKKKRGNDQ